MSKILLFISIFNFTFLHAQSTYDYQEVLAETTSKIDLTIKFASFPQGEKGLNNYISENIEYPETALYRNIEGKVQIKYTVNKNGKIKHLKKIKGQYRPLIQEAKRVLKSMNEWKPGLKGTKPIRSKYIQDFNFILI